MVEHEDHDNMMSMIHQYGGICTEVVWKTKSVSLHESNYANVRE